MSVHQWVHWATAVATVGLFAALPCSAFAQAPPLPSEPASASDEQPVLAGVEIRGNQRIEEDQVRRHIKARAGVPYDPALVRQDVKRLYASRWFHRVRPVLQERPEGMVLIYEVSERPTAEAVRFIGNRHFSDKKLLKECGLKPGDSLNAYSLREAKRKIENLYRKAGIAHTTVEIAEGDRPRDSRAVFVIHEGKLQRIYKVEFEGNDPKLATDGRLKTIVQTKPGFLKYFIWGKYDEEKIEQDVERLTAYYRNLGYFRARISRELEWSENGSWVTVRFVIDEGPRYRVRDVRILGNKQFATADLLKQLELQPGDYFQMSELRRDEKTLRDIYGGQGYIFADIEANPRFAEEPGVLDLVYKVEEGEQFRVGKVVVHINGEVPHTKISVVLNRLSLRPGDIIDNREILASERRLKASSVFETDPSNGQPPRIEILPLGTETTAGGAGRSSRTVRRPSGGNGGHGRHSHLGNAGPTFRGQSPDQPRTRAAVVHVYLPRLKQ